MTSLNTVALVGRVTADVKLQFTGRDMPYIFFSVAVNRSVKKGDQYEEEASYIDCKLYGKSAEALEKYLTKGKLVSLDGSLRQHRPGHRPHLRQECFRRRLPAGLPPATAESRAIPYQTYPHGAPILRDSHLPRHPHRSKARIRYH